MSNLSQPVVSILVASYNSASFIEQTVNSCLNQQFDNYEIIISDDNSTDNTWSIIEKFNSPKLRKYRQVQNLGEYTNRNFLIKEALGDFIIFIDGEDLLYPHALRVFSDCIKKYPEAGQCIAKEWDEKIIYPVAISPVQFARMEFMGHGVTGLNFTRLFLKRELLLLQGGFTNNSSKLGDLYIQCRLGLQYETILIPEGFSWWRRRSGQASEKILQDPLLYQAEVNKFIPAMIEGINGIPADERKTMFRNYYGNVLRLLLYRCLRLKFGPVTGYLHSNPIPRKFLSSFFKKPVRNYMDQYNGEHPLKDN